jgi:hypothetical protein
LRKPPTVWLVLALPSLFVLIRRLVYSRAGRAMVALAGASAAAWSGST